MILTIILVLHAMGFGAYFVFCLIANAVGGMFAAAYSWGGKKDPVWLLFLQSLVWEIMIGAELVSVVKEKWHNLYHS
jgi:hypothetical protein